PQPPCVDRSFLSGPPNAGTIYRPVSSVESTATPATREAERRTKAICVPSGDQSGQMNPDGCCVKRSEFSLLTAFTYRSAPFNPAAGSPLQEKAICDPSGENVGHSSNPG